MGGGRGRGGLGGRQNPGFPSELCHCLKWSWESHLPSVCLGFPTCKIRVDETCLSWEENSEG